MKKATLKISGVKLRPSQVHKMRGFISNLFEKHDLIHNHDVKTGKLIYRYPLIQFKVLENAPFIVALTEKAINIFGELFMNLNHLEIEDLTIPVNEKELSVENNEFGITDDMIQYEFVHPWAALNQKNYRKYHDAESFSEKKEMLNAIMIGNILSMSKHLDYTVKGKIKVETILKPVKINLKTKSMIGFIGGFKTNFKIPDFCGIGKFVESVRVLAEDMEL